jgi:ubiquinone biosynthesis protein Coq4
MLITPGSTNSITPCVNWFLSAIDRVSKTLHLNVPAIVNLNELHPLPPGTLGRELAEFYDRHHLQPFTTGPRRKQLHDSIHVLTGYNTDPLGEAEVQAFLLGSHFRVTHMVIGMGLIRIIRRQRLHLDDEVRDRLWQAYWRGWHSSFEVDQWRPETLWSEPLTTIRQQYNLSLE